MLTTIFSFVLKLDFFKIALYLVFTIATTNAQDQIYELICSDLSCEPNETSLAGASLSLNITEPIEHAVLMNSQPFSLKIPGLAISGIIGGCTLVVTILAWFLYWKFHHKRKGRSVFGKTQPDEESGRLSYANHSGFKYASLDIPPMLPPIPPIAYNPESFYTLEYLRNTAPLLAQLNIISRHSVHIESRAEESSLEYGEVSPSLLSATDSTYDSSDSGSTLYPFFPNYNMKKYLSRIEEENEDFDYKSISSVGLSGI